MLTPLHPHHLRPTRVRALALACALLVGLAAPTAGLAQGQPEAAAAQIPGAVLSLGDALPPALDAASDPVPDFLSYSMPGPLPGGEGIELQHVRGGAVIGAVRSGRYAMLPVAELQPGDTARVVRTRAGTELAAYTYDGLPQFDPATTCGGTMAFSGTRTPGMTVGYVAARRPGSDGSDYDPGPGNDHTGTLLDDGAGQPGGRFAGTFRFPLVIGQLLDVAEGLGSIDGLSINVSATRVVGACPAGGPTPPAPPGPPSGRPEAPQLTLGTVALPKGLTFARLLRRGLPVPLTVDRQATAHLTLALTWIERRPARRRGKVRRPAQVVERSKALGAASAPMLAGRAASPAVQVKTSARRLLRAHRKDRTARLVVGGAVTASGFRTPIPETSLRLPRR